MCDSPRHQVRIGPVTQNGHGHVSSEAQSKDAKAVRINNFRTTEKSVIITTVKLYTS